MTGTEAIAGNPADALSATKAAKAPARETLRRAYEALAGGTPKALKAVVAADVEIWFRGEPQNVPFGGRWAGVDGVGRFAELYAANVRNPQFRTRYSMIQEDASGLTLMLFLLEQGTAAPTGRDFRSESVHEWRFDGAGRISRFTSWNNSFDFYQAFAREPVDPSLVYRHPLEEALATPGRPCAVDPGAAVERFYKCLLTDDVEGFGRVMTPEVVSTLEGVEGVVPFSGTYRGIDAVKSQVASFYRVARAVVDEVIMRYVVDGNRICTRLDEAGTYVYATKSPLFFRNLHCFAVNDAGRIETFRSYNDTWRVWLACTPRERRPVGAVL